MGAALRGQGHEVRLIPAQFIKPYRKSNKNDFIDAEAIAEAVTKHNMRFVQIKTEEQLDVQAMHRVRDRLVQRRTALINEIRGFLLERGITFAASPIHLRKSLPVVIEDAEQNLSARLRWLLERMWQEWKQVELDTDGDRCVSTRSMTCPLAVASRKLTYEVLVRGHLILVCLSPWAGLRSLGWHRAPPILHRRQAEAVRHQQARQRLSASHANPRSTRGTASRQVRHGRVRAVGAPTRSACTAQQGRCRNRQQTGAHGLGRIVQRQRLSTPAAANDRSVIRPWKRRCAWKAQNAFHFSTATTTFEQTFTKVCEERRRRNDSPTACRKTWWR